MIGSPSYAYKSIIGIEFERESVKAVAAVKNGVGLKIKKTIDSPIGPDWLLSEPDKLGEEIRNQLNQAGVQDSHCMICLPLQWILKHRIEIPNLSADDLQNYIHLQAERAFPFPLDELSLSTTWYQTDDGKRFASISAVRLSHIETLRNVCKKAKLTPVSFSITTPPDMKELGADNAVFLKKREDGLDCQIIRQGKTIGFRFFETDFSQPLEDALPALFRDIRVTLSELPPSVQSSIHAIAVCGANDWANEFIRMATPYAEPLRMRIVSLNALQTKLPGANGEAYWISPIYHAANRFVAEKKAQIEFLPPRTNRFKQWIEKISSRGSLVAGASVAAAVFMAIAAMLYQHITWSNLDAKWESMRDQVDELELIQQDVKQFRPWFDESLPVLSGINALVEAFPEEGSIWVKLIEIDENHVISCSGFVRDTRTLLELYQKLDKDERFRDRIHEQTQGDSPIKFSFKIQWVGN